MPMQRARYPPEWEELSRRLRAFGAQGRCEWCGVDNGAYGARDRAGVWHDEAAMQTMTSTEGFSLFPAGFPRCVHIVLTCAHLDHNPESADESRIVVLCQKCHNDYDRPMRQSHARRTRLRHKHARYGLLPFAEETPLLPRKEV